MDSLTARYLARELDELWRGRRVRSCLFDGERAAVALAVDGSTPVVFDLSSPDVQLRAEVENFADAPASRRSLLDGWSVRGVDAPLDDRRLVVDLVKPGRFKGSPERRATLAVSALPTARGAELRDAGGHRLAAIGARLPRAAEPRPVLSVEEVAGAAHAGDDRALLAGRWMSRAVAAWLVREPGLAAERYSMILSDTPARPAWCDAALVPFPMCPDAVDARSLIAPPASGEPREGETRAGETRADDGKRNRAERARQRMEYELERASAAPFTRAVADALALLADSASSDVPAPDQLVLADGAVASVEAKPGESAREAAERHYAQAKSMERALQLLPARIAALAVRTTSVHPDEQMEPQSARKAARRSAAPPAALPYRSYRSSNGLEIRVGKGAAANDALTFKASSPDDVWLHARDSAGAHVVLRWQDEANPPARSLAEAAALAALYSKSRGSALVPVDWTRRKYVRRARGGAPGAVIVQRARTVMARPDAALEKRLREL